MYLLSDRLYYKEEITIQEDHRQIIFTHVDNPLIGRWLEKTEVDIGG